jgi:hypothetical protein
MSSNLSSPPSRNMATQSSILTKQPSRRAAIAAMMLCLAVTGLTVIAQQPAEPPPAASAVVVAREILEIQNDLGGSIVGDLSQESPLAAAEFSEWHLPPPETPVDELRDTAWRLDASAHRLECLDLYGQADALRELANQLRQDARDMKWQTAGAMKRQAADSE